MDGLGDNITTSNFGEKLPQIIRENELQKTIADERMRAEQHKSNYQTLKLDYLRLQQDFSSLQKTFEDMNNLREKDKSLLAQARQEIIKKVKENENLKSQILDPQKIKIIQLQVEEEVEGSYKDKLKQHQRDYEALRSEHNKLKTEHIFLKSEYENDRKQYLSMLEENKMKYEAEMSVLKQERQSKLMQKNEDSLDDFKQLKELEHKNTQLMCRVKNLEQENLELRGQKNYSGLQVDSINRVNSKVTTEYQSTIKTFEIERQMMKSQMENLHKELLKISEEKNQTVIQRLELEKRMSSLSNKMEETEQEHKKEVYETRVCMLKERGSLEEDLNSLKVLFEDAKSEMEVLHETVQDLERSLLEKEKEGIRKVQLTKEEHWNLIHQLETEKIAMEAKVKEQEKKSKELEINRDQALENFEGKTLELDEMKEGFEKEIEKLRSKLVNQEILLDQLEKEKIETSNLKNRMLYLESKFKAFTEGEKELLDQNASLEKQVAEMSKERQTTIKEEGKNREAMEKDFSERLSVLMEEKCRLHSQIDELKNHVQLIQRKMVNNAQLYKEKKMRLKKILLKYKQQLSGLAFKLDQDGQEDKRTQDTSGDVEMLRSKLGMLLRKNQEFWNLLTSTKVQEKFIGGLPFASVSYDFLPYSNGNLEWNNLKKKMEDMDEKLRLQLEEIQGRNS